MAHHYRMLWMSFVMQLLTESKRTGACLLMLCLLLLVLPLQWLIAAFIAVAIHECGHYIAVRLLGGHVHRMSFSTSGAVMEASGLSKRAELVCIIAGPLSGFILGMTFRWFPMVAICGTVQSLYNLLPIYPLDGGRLLRSIVALTGLPDRFISVIEISVLITLLCLCIYIRIRFGIGICVFFVLSIFLSRN